MRVPPLRVEGGGGLFAGQLLHLWQYAILAPQETAFHITRLLSVKRLCSAV